MSQTGIALRNLETNKTLSIDAILPFEKSVVLPYAVEMTLGDGGIKVFPAGTKLKRHKRIGKKPKKPQGLAAKKAGTVKKAKKAKKAKKK